MKRVEIIIAFRNISEKDFPQRENNNNSIKIVERVYFSVMNQHR
jgi:hypothetical protein